MSQRLLTRQETQLLVELRNGLKVTMSRSPAGFGATFKRDDNGIDVYYLLSKLHDKGMVKLDLTAGTVAILPIDVVQEVEQLTWAIRLDAFQRVRSIIVQEVGNIERQQRLDFKAEMVPVITALNRMADRVEKLK